MTLGFYDFYFYFYFFSFLPERGFVRVCFVFTFVALRYSGSSLFNGRLQQVPDQRMGLDPVLCALCDCDCDL